VHRQLQSLADAEAIVNAHLADWKLSVPARDRLVCSPEGFGGADRNWHPTRGTSKPVDEFREWNSNWLSRYAIRRRGMSSLVGKEKRIIIVFLTVQNRCLEGLPCCER